MVESNESNEPNESNQMKRVSHIDGPGKRINLLVGVRNEAVRLDVSLVAHPQPERIAEVVPGGERDAACPISTG